MANETISDELCVDLLECVVGFAFLCVGFFKFIFFLEYAGTPLDCITDSCLSGKYRLPSYILHSDHVLKHKNVQPK